MNKHYTNRNDEMDDEDEDNPNDSYVNYDDDMPVKDGEDANDSAIIHPEFLEPLPPLNWKRVYLTALVSVVIPALFTAWAPVTFLQLTKEKNSVSATTKTCMLLCVPLSIKRVQDLTASKLQVQDAIRKELSKGLGLLVLTGSNAAIEIPLLQQDLAETKKQIDFFLEREDQTEFSKICISNWELSIFAGVPLSILTLIFAFACFNRVYCTVHDAFFRQNGKAPNSKCDMVMGLTTSGKASR